MVIYIANKRDLAARSAEKECKNIIQLTQMFYSINKKIVSVHGYTADIIQLVVTK